MSEMINKTAPEGNVPLYLFRSGKNSHSYEYMGVHNTIKDGKACTVCRVWAPNAQAVAITGDFCEWDPEKYPLTKIDDAVWEGYTDEPLKEFDTYKLVITAEDGTVTYKADPYAFHAETRPGTASRYYDISGYKWNDSRWFEHKKKYPHYNQPVNIYEMHAGSWRKYADGSVFSYDKLGDELIPYVQEMGFTHIELMPLTEYPFDASWGYQVTGYFAPTSRYGTPKDFMRFIDRCHQAGIGVIMDWVPGHFPRDEAGLAKFDGMPCYEYADPRKGEHKEWGTLVFDYGRTEVISFLMSSALFWVKEYHIDGLRVDAVASMLYLDYNRKDGEWIPNKNGGKENLEAIAFLQRLNEAIFAEVPEVMMIAEESTAWPMVTKPTYMGGLGFNYKWNMGWMNDFLGYMEQDPYFRCHHYNELTFSMIYAYSENFVLVFSHDEVVHGKGSLVNKMPGQTFEDKFANLRAAYGFMMGHPGKKLLFMGQDFAQMDEWNENASIEWELLQYPIHSQMKEYVKELNHLYTSHPALYQKDYQTEGFEWINCMDAADNIIAFLRRGADETLLFVCNFAPQLHEKLAVGVPFKGKYKEIFNSDAEKFGGSGKVNPRMKSSKAEECDGKDNSITIQLAPLGISVFSCTPTEPEKKEKPAKVKKTTHSTKSVKEKAETDPQSMMAEAASAFNGKAGGTAAAAAERLAGISDKLAEAKAGLSSKIISLSSIARRQAGLEEGLDKKVGKE